MGGNDNNNDPGKGRYSETSLLVQSEFQLTTKLCLVTVDLDRPSVLHGPPSQEGRDSRQLATNAATSCLVTYLRND
jgi:hypothetical protein